MQYSSKTAEFAPADFLLQIIGLKIDYNQLLLAKSELFEGRNSKNGEINVFLDCFQLILMGFLTTSLNKNSQNDVKLLETWWFWHILGKGTHIYSNQKHPDFHQKSPWTPKSQLSPVCYPERYTSPSKEAGLVIYLAFLAKVANLYYMILTAFKKYWPDTVAKFTSGTQDRFI